MDSKTCSSMAAYYRLLAILWQLIFFELLNMKEQKGIIKSFSIDMEQAFKEIQNWEVPVKDSTKIYS